MFLSISAIIDGRRVFFKQGRETTAKMLTPQLEDAKRLCDDETKERQSLLGRFRNLEHEYDGMNVILEEEVWMVRSGIFA